MRSPAIIAFLATFLFSSIKALPKPSDGTASILVPPIPDVIANKPSLKSSSAAISSLSKPASASGCRPSWNTQGNAPSIGTLKAAIFFVDFPDKKANTTIEDLWAPIASAPKQLYNTMSYGKLDLEITRVSDKFQRMPAASTSYGYSRGLTAETHAKYINDALSAIGKTVSFAGYDVLYVAPATTASDISFSATYMDSIKAPDGSKFTRAITFGQDLYTTWKYKTINHETGHAMGLPDLYPYCDNSGKSCTVEQWVGGFDIMGLIAGQSPDYFAWHKWYLGWINDTQVDCVKQSGTTTHHIGPVEVSEDAARNASKAIAVSTNSTGYVMVEVRSNLGIDETACGTGVLLYTADTAVQGGKGPLRVIDTKLGSGCGKEQGDFHELNDAPLKNGEQFDTGLGVIVRVKAQDSNDFTVEIQRK